MSDTLDSKAIGDSRYQEKTVQALLQDHEYAEQISDVLKAEFFDQKHLKEIVEVYFWYREKYDAFPSSEIIEEAMRKNGASDVIRTQATAFFQRSEDTPLNGDIGFIKDTSLEFCRKQALIGGVTDALDQIEVGNFDSVLKVIMDSASKGASRDIGHDYMEGFQTRSEKSIRSPVPTPWPVLNDIFNGGWERGTLATCIAPTGAGKTHFLCNVSAGGIAAGHNVCYITLEIADFKIGLRHDAYFSGLKINDIPGEMEQVEEQVRGTVKGRLFIKEFPTKRASVQTVRAYLQRLKALKGFIPDILVLDYADLLKSSRTYTEKRHECESVYEELRGLANDPEFNKMVIVTADQSNRGGLDQEVVTIASIAESYAKATVCDLIMSVSRRLEDKATNTGRLAILKSRLGPDGIVYPFMMNTATVKMSILKQVETVSQALDAGEEAKTNNIRERARKLAKKRT